MEDKIRKIMDESTDYQTGEVDAEIAISKLLDLFSVSQQRELLLAYEKNKCPNTWWMSEGEVTNSINNFLANNCG